MTNFYIHKDGYLYNGDLTEGAREATREEINSFLYPEPTPAEIQKALTDAVQAYMDGKANERGYDNIHTACTYAMSTDPVFKAEADACLSWRDNVWRTCYNILGEVTAGLREIPTVDELIFELPGLIWPEV